MSRIPFVNLERQFRSLEPEIRAAMDGVLKSRAFIQGPAVEAFTLDFAHAIGAPSVVGCANGTAALSIALEALSIGPGDEVITVANTFFATVEAIYHVGASPVFVDADPRTQTLDPTAVAAAIKPRTRALIAVHLFGAPCDMDSILTVARSHDLLVIEDAAQAHLASYRGRYAGTLGDAAGFSFYPGKNLGAFGDAGAIVCRDASTTARARKLIDHGRSNKYEHDAIGYNQRMDSLQAAILSVKLRHLPAWTEHRRAAAQRYRNHLAPAGFTLPQPVEGGEPVYHLMVVEVSNREETMQSLRTNDIDCGVHYPVPLHLQPALRDRFPRLSLPVTERLAQRNLSLPICGEITNDEIDRVCDQFLRVARP